jgi:hypothetical protein
MSPSTVAVADDQELITHRTRRQLCTVLNRAGSIPIPRLAARIADRLATGSATSTEQLRIALRHNHLPRLAERGLVRYARGGETVTLPDRVSFEDGDDDLVTYATVDDPVAPDSGG